MMEVGYIQIVVDSRGQLVAEDCKPVAVDSKAAAEVGCIQVVADNTAEAEDCIQAAVDYIQDLILVYFRERHSSRLRTAELRLDE